MTLHPQLIFPEGGVEVGLFFVADRPIRGKFPSFPAARTIQTEEYERVQYGPAPEPEQADYFWCEDCNEHHLRECFDSAPPVIGVVPWRRCYVELAERLGYRRVEQGPPKPPFPDNIISFPEVTFTNRTRLIWIMDGWFISYQGHFIGLELFDRGRITLTKESSLKLIPRITLGP